MELKDNQNLWKQILRAVETKIDPNSFETWFDPTTFIGREQDCLYVKVPNAYFRDWLSFHYSNIIAEACRDLFGKVLDIRYIHEDTPTAFMRRSPDERKTKQGNPVNPNLNPNYTFGNFVVGSCNQFAHAAATAVSKNPAKSYNPLYIYGGAGLGKTHLMNAIGHFALQQNSRATPRVDSSIIRVPGLPGRNHLPTLEGRGDVSLASYRQTRPAPLLFMLAGLGSNPYFGVAPYLASLFYRKGFNVVILPSPMNWNFALSASRSGAPGYTPEDARDLYEVMQKTLTALPSRYAVKATSINFVGVSLGALEGSFLSVIDADEGKVGIDKYLLVNQRRSTSLTPSRKSINGAR